MRNFLRRFRISHLEPPNPTFKNDLFPNRPNKNTQTNKNIYGPPDDIPKFTIVAANAKWMVAANAEWMSRGTTDIN